MSTFVLELDFINNMPNQNEVVLLCIHYARITIIYLQHGFLAHNHLDVNRGVGMGIELLTFLVSNDNKLLTPSY